MSPTLAGDAVSRAVEQFAGAAPFRSAVTLFVKDREDSGMYIDWVTWSIWLLGFAILVIWVVIPYRELRTILRSRHESSRGDQPS